MSNALSAGADRMSSSIRDFCSSKVMVFYSFPMATSLFRGQGKYTVQNKETQDAFVILRKLMHNCIKYIHGWIVNFGVSKNIAKTKLVM